MVMVWIQTLFEQNHGLQSGPKRQGQRFHDSWAQETGGVVGRDCFFRMWFNGTENNCKWSSCCPRLLSFRMDFPGLLKEPMCSVHSAFEVTSKPGSCQRSKPDRCGRTPLHQLAVLVDMLIPCGYCLREQKRQEIRMASGPQCWTLLLLGMAIWMVQLASS